MGTAVSKRKNVRSDAICSVAAKVRAARAISDYLSTADTDPQNGADHLLSDTCIVPDCDSPLISRFQNNNLPSENHCPPKPSRGTPACTHPSRSTPVYTHPSQAPVVPVAPVAPVGPSKRRLSGGDRSVSSEERIGANSSREKPSRVYTITCQSSMTLGARGSEESLELDALKASREQALAQAPLSSTPSCVSQPPRTTTSHHRSSHHRSSQPSGTQPQSAAVGPLKSSGSAANIRDWGLRRRASREDYSPDCVSCIRAPCQSQRSLDLDLPSREGGKPRKKLERMYSEDRALSEDREDGPNSWFPKENMFSFQTATTTMQANFRKHLRMVGSRRVKVQTFVDRRAKSFSRSWSDPTPVKPESLHDSRDSADLPTSTGALDEDLGKDADWEEEREQERSACQGDDFIPPKIMLISSKVPKAEYVPNIIRRDDPSIIPILYDHEHATFDDILEEIEKKLTAYRKGCRIWNMLIFCQGGPGHLYLLKNKVATFAKVEKEDDMIQFWRRLSRLMSKLNPEPNVIHVMGCYVLGSANGEKLIQTLKRLMRPSAVEFKSPLELSAQGKEMIETYFDFRLFRLWKNRQHSKLLDYDDLL
ncbi:unnamed protein product [Knipowitschia caucasica]|uniref:DUF4347 domain-containing protein n=1 Tax=Knipowitschia caucasica TaxID=637954 RepID=A0AAV2MQ00_KNICA